ncbi:MAG TPA: cytochrome C oxidase subunit IV family protein [Acidimicrobiales bacterium]
MTATDVEPTEPGETMPASHVEAHGHQHPSDRQYAVVAIILAVITAAEVGTYFMDDPSTALLAGMLFPMMIAKFVIVCGWFMHLRYDNPIFRRVFVFGLLLAVVVYVVGMMTAFEFWSAVYPG